MRLTQRIRKLLFPITRRVRSAISPPLKKGGPPTGIFSEYDQIRREEITGEILANSDQMRFPSDSEITLAGLDQDRYQNWKTVWTYRKNAFLAAPSLVHSDGNGQVAAEALYGCHAWKDPVWRRSQALPLRKLNGDFTSMISRWNDGTNYFHWLMDGLSRLIHLENFPSECKILVPAGLPQFAIQSLKLLGVADRTVEHSGEDLEIERYWFAGPTMLSGCPDERAVRWLRKKFLQTEPESGSRRIYIERKAPTRHLINASELREYFHSAGWEIIDPATLRFEKQIELFREARLVAGVHGAALTNLLWVPLQTQALEFMPSRRRNGCYAGIALATGTKLTTMVCKSTKSGNISIPIDLVSRWVQAAEKNLL